MHQHHHAKSSKSGKALQGALMVTSFFMVIEFVGGWFSNSLALMSDALHMLTDVGALSLSFFAFWLASRPKSPRMSFGYARAEILGALLNGLLIWLLSGFLVYEAYLRLKAPPEVSGQIVVVVGMLGLGINVLSLGFLNRAKEEKNLNIRAAIMHVTFDLLGSLAAVVSGVVIWLTNWVLIDPILTFMTAILILVASWRLVRESVEVLMESAPTHLDPQVIEKALLEIPGVEALHDLHIWTVSDSQSPAMSVHLISKEAETTLSQAHEILKKNYSILHTTIQVEHPDQFDSSRCYDCASGS